MDSDRDQTDAKQVRHRLYEVIDDAELSLAEKQTRVLELGRSYLGVMNGYIQKLTPEEEADRIVASTGEDPDLFPTGMRVDRSRSYCRRVIEEDSPVALSNAPDQGWAEDPAYEDHGVECYLGTTIFVDGSAYGTVCFVSRAARETDFTAEEKAFIELISRLLGREIEAAEYEADLAERAQAQHRLEGKYEALLELAPDAIFITDASTAILETNAKAVELTGYAAAELTERTLVDLHPEANRERYSQLYTEGIETNPRDEFDDGLQFEICLAGGSTVPVELSLRTVELDGQVLKQVIVRDITDRRDREQDLRAKNQAIEESTVGITIADADQSDLPITYANEGFERLTGYSKDRAVGNNCRFLQGEATDEETVAEIRAAIDAEQSIRTQILNYRASGVPFWNQLTVAPVTGDDGDEVSHYVGIQEDITARKRRDRLIEVMDRVLRHNLRNDMNVVKGFAEMIGDQTDGEVARMAGRIEKTAAGVTDLSEKAQSFEAAVRDADSLDERDIITELRAVVSDLRRDYPDVEFGIDAHTSGTVLVTDRLRLALRELGENAAEHAGSPVLYRVEMDDDGRLVVRVRDTGPGLPPLERTVLEVGRETPLEHGLGLGLWLVNWIVTGLGGEVSASVDNGTTVTIRLPPATEGVATDRPDSHRYAAISTKRE